MSTASVSSLRLEIRECVVGFDEGTDRLAVRLDARGMHAAVAGFDDGRLVCHLGTPLHGKLESRLRVGYGQRHVVHPGAVEMHVIRHRMLWALRAGDHEANVARLEQVRARIRHTRLRTPIRRYSKPEHRAEELRGLIGVANPPLEVRKAHDGEGVPRGEVPRPSDHVRAHLGLPVDDGWANPSIAHVVACASADVAAKAGTRRPDRR